MSTNHTACPDDSVTAEAWHWAVRLHELSRGDHARLDRWLQESDAHRAEFEAARRDWQALGVLRLLQRERVDRGDPWVARKRHRRSRARRGYRPLAAVAALAAMALVTWWMFPRDFQAEYRTEIGEQLHIDLPDQSAVILNTDTRLSVRFTDEARTVYLEKGEAYFEIAPDSTEPFIVFAGGGLVRAVGTAFNVYVHEREARVDVIVTEGEVEISKRRTRDDTVAPAVDSFGSRTRPCDADCGGQSAPAVDSVASRTAMKRVTAGQNARITHTIAVVAAVDREVLERKLSWQHGMLTFVNAPLGQVIAEADRYTPKTLVIADPQLERYPVTIISKATNIDGLLRNLDDSSDVIDVTQVSDERVLISRAAPRSTTVR